MINPRIRFLQDQREKVRSFESKKSENDYDDLASVIHKANNAFNRTSETGYPYHLSDVIIEQFNRQKGNNIHNTTIQKLYEHLPYYVRR
jgi:hypothetical protein